jgi:hypothetical protein
VAFKDLDSSHLADNHADEGPDDDGDREAGVCMRHLVKGLAGREADQADLRGLSASQTTAKLILTLTISWRDWRILQTWRNVGPATRWAMSP